MSVVARERLPTRGATQPTSSAGTGDQHRGADDGTAGRAPAARSNGGDEAAYRSALAAFARVSGAAAGGASAGELLRLLAACACEALGIARCAVYVRDDERGVFTGRAGHPGDDLDAGVRRLVMGGAADAITAEIVRTRAPVVIRDARTDPRAARTVMREWRVRSVLGVPMLRDGEVVGLLYLDNAGDPHPYKRVHVEIAAALADLGAAELAQLEAAAAASGRLAATARQNRLLRRVAGADHRLGQVLQQSGRLQRFAEALAELTGKPAALYDHTPCRVAAAAADGDDTGLEVRLVEDAGPGADVESLLRAVQPGTSTVVGPLLRAGIGHRHLVAPVDVAGDRWGWVVVKEHLARLGAFDELVLRRAAAHVALEIAARRRVSSAAWDARSLLVRQLIRGVHDEDARRSADHLGVALDVPRVVAFVTRAEHLGADVDAGALVGALAAGGAGAAGEVLATKGPEGVALLVEVEGDLAPLAAARGVREALARAAAAVGGRAKLVVGVSSLCRDPTALPRGYREAREVARCLDRFGGGAAPRVLAADDLGPGRVFVANGESEAIERYVDDVIGPLLGGDERSADLLRTLSTFFDTGRNVRLSAAPLGVHENTVRYRLARVHALCGLDVASDPGDQLSVQMALLVLRLGAHPALPGFAAAAGAA